MTKSTKLTFPLLCATALTLFTGCVTPGPTPPPPTQTTSYKLPQFKIVEGEAKESQSKGGIEISVAPVAYQMTQKEKKTRRQVSAPLFGTLDLDERLRPYAKFFEETTTIGPEVTPTRIAYLVKINNTLSRVFRGAGTVVQFNAGGKLVAVDQAGYAELAQAIIPPRGELQVTVYGPLLSQVADKATLGLFLYDVVTATDAAGNITQKQNYEWFFEYSVKTEEGTLQVEKKIIRTVPELR